LPNFNETFSISLAYNDKIVELPFGKMSSFDELYIDFNIEKRDQFLRIKLTIHPKESVVLKDLVLKKIRNYSLHERIFCNGFQSWSESKEYGLEEIIPKIKPFFTSNFNLQGDNQIKLIQRGKGHFHSWTYSYVRSNEDLDFIGSLNENNAFTIIQHDTENQSLSIRKECNGLQLNHSFPILDVVFLKGKEQQVFDQYFNLMGIQKSTKQSLTGWTSWYNYYTEISEDIILKNADAFSKKECPIDIIQIDDGYQKHVGDWLKTETSFPNGMGKIAKEIKRKSFKAGIWIAPFICDGKSEIFKNKKKWLVKDEKGKPLKVGYNSLWKGWFYAFDFYNQEVQKYLSSVFFTLTDKWHFDLIKLDFLYAVCIKPPKNKTRGQVMSDALTFLRNLTKDQMIIGCGVPLGSAFGKVDFCRIGSDIHLKWEDTKLKWLGHRERTSTIGSLRSVLSRWQLNKRAFYNDPDVLILRDSNNKLNFNQRNTLLIINTLLGNLLFTSDEIGAYSDEQWSEFESIFKWKNSEVSRVEDLRNDQYVIHFLHEGISWLAFCNLTNKKATFGLFKKDKIVLEPFESLILQNK
jgi:Glycosyl hydrolases family 31 TIM-barrel domain